MIDPSGYWYIVAYEQRPTQPTTWGTTPTEYDTFVYYDRRPIDGAWAAGEIVGAQTAHQKPYSHGAVRAWWWNGATWVRYPRFDRDW